MWKKKVEKKAENKEEEKEGSLLKELCGEDAKLYDLLSDSLYIDPLVAISEKDIDVLTEEGEKSGNFRSAMDKAMFEATQNPGERERYTKVIQDLASKTIHATEQVKEKVEKEGLTDRAASLGKIIEHQELIIARTEDILNIASRFYNERLVELEEISRREARSEERGRVITEGVKEEKREVAMREARKQERKNMGREEIKEAKKQDKIEELAAEARREARSEERRDFDREELRIKDQENAERESRRQERKDN